MSGDDPRTIPNGFADEVASRLGVLSNFFSGAPAEAGMAEQLWAFARSAYLDNPLPSLFKERLFVHLSRFCEARYCIVRHVGFLIGKGRPAGDAAIKPLTVEQAIRLLERPVPNAAGLKRSLERLQASGNSRGLPAADTEDEARLFDALAVMFLVPNRSTQARAAVRARVGDTSFERLTALLAFVRTAHYWTETHPDLEYEPDMAAVIEDNPRLAALLRNTDEAVEASSSGQLRHALEALRSEHRETEITLRKTEQREALLLGLGDALRPLADPTEIMAVALRILGEAVGAGWAFYAEHAATGTTATMSIRHEYRRDDGPSLAGTYPVVSHELFERLKEGRTMAVADIFASDLFSEAARARWGKSGMRSIAAVPIVKGGIMLATLIVADAEPRDWSGDLGWIEEAAERTWATVERARAQAELGESEAKYRSLFESIDAGYCVIEALFDAQGHPIDYIFLEANPAFVAQTGLADAIGHRMRTLVPHHEQFWFDTYGRIALTGQPEHFEHRADALDRWYIVDAFRIGAPHQHQVAILFHDVKDRRMREQQTVLLDQIGQDLALQSDPDDVMQAVGARLGSFLDLSSCLLLDVDDELGEVSVHHAWESEQSPSPSMRQTFRLHDYVTTEFDRANRAGENFVVSNAARDERVDARAHAALKVGAFVVIPYLKGGVWRGYIVATSVLPRDWRDDEVMLLKEASNRLFARIEQARAEQALRQSEARLHTLVAELQHRVRNILAVVRSVFRRTANTAEDPEELSSHFVGRLDALARTQVIVTRTAAGDVDLESMIRDELLSVGASDGPNVRIAGPDVSLSSKIAESLGMAIHELTTNALKYGALKIPGARLDISWKSNPHYGGGHRLNLVWQEQGVPTVPVKPVREGFGRELIQQALPYRLGAETKLEFLGGGVRCSISLTLPD